MDIEQDMSSEGLGGTGMYWEATERCWEGTEEVVEADWFILIHNGR